MVHQRILKYALLAAVAAATLPACQVKYRREVEKPGTPAKWSYSAGGFMRYDGYDDVAGDLEVGVREYVKPGSGARVRLVGAIHIGDLDYYKTLQKETMDDADVVLFEGVKFEGDAKPPDLGGVYGAMGSLLGIGFQKDGINYKAGNFVHCDITVKDGDPLFQTVDPEQMNQASMMLQPLASMKAMFTAGGDARRTEDALKHGMVTIMAMQMGGEEAGGGDAKDLAERAAEKLGAGDKNNPLRKQAQDALEQLRKAGGGQIPGMPEGMKREVLDRRNAYVMNALRARLDADGDQKQQTIAVFYGAAHLQGMEKDLLSWGYQPVETSWFKAWRMNGAKQPVLAERIAETGTGAKQGVAPAGRARAGRKGEPTLF